MSAAQAITRDALRDYILSRVPVIGLATPELGPPLLLQASSGPDGHLIRLGYGVSDDPAGPHISVLTQVSQRMPLAYIVSPARSALSYERGRIFERAGVDEPENDVTNTVSSHLLINERRLAARVRYEAQLWAAQATIPRDLVPTHTSPRERAITVAISRGVPVEDVTLALEFDLRPAWEAYESRRSALASPGDRREAPLPDGLDALTDLIASTVAQRRSESAPNRPQRRSASELRDEWEAAVRTQMRYAGQPREEASEAIMMLVSQLGELAASVGWWREAGDAATAESIRYTVFASAVRSDVAQRIWTKRHRVDSEHSAWLEAWEQWYASMPPGA